MDSMNSCPEVAEKRERFEWTKTLRWEKLGHIRAE